MRTGLRLPAIILLTVGMAGIQVAPTHAATTLTVSTCTADSGPGSLRAAVAQANSDNAGDTIVFSCSGTIYLTSGVVTLSGDLTIDGRGQRVTIDGNHSTRIFNSNGTVTINDLTLADGYDNYASAGAAINNTGSLNVTNSTFTDNVIGDGYGAAIWNGGSATIVDSTFYRNNAYGAGGAIANQESGMVTIRNSTLADNIAESGGGAIANRGSTVTVAGSIVYGNTSPNCVGTIGDGGYNVDGSTSCNFGAPTDQQNTNPDLGPLADNGGPTDTMALLAGSPAIDQIPVSVTSLCSPSGTDQRGYPRPDAAETVCDIGAYEYQDGFATPTGGNAYDIESSNFYCSDGGTSCVPSGSVATDCEQTVACPGLNYADVEAFGPPNGSTFGVPDEIVLYCSHGTSTGYDYGYLDVVSPQGNSDYPAGSRPGPGVYGRSDMGVISGKGTLLGGGSESNPSQTSSLSASAYDPGTGVRGFVTGIQNTDNGTDSLNAGSFRVTLSGTLYRVALSGSAPTTTTYTGSISCTVGGPTGPDLAYAGLDTSALAEGELENVLGDHQE